MTSTISIHPADGKVKLVRVKHEVTYTVPPAPSDCLPAELAPHIQALRSLHAPYPPARLAARRVWFRSLVRRYKCPIEARLAAIDARLSEVTDMETVNNLLEEKAEIMDRLERE
jgi:hypothetical protein